MNSLRALQLELLKTLQALVIQLTLQLQTMQSTKSGNQLLYEKAVSYLGKDASPKDIAPDTLGCAESVSNIMYDTFGDTPQAILGTYTLYDTLRKHPKYKATLTPKPGSIIVCPTGMGRLKNGHTGIVGVDNKIMSNNSYAGEWQENYTWDSWIAYYKTHGGFRIFLFDRV